MRILLAHNSLYYPAYGGGDKSNRLLMEALAARGHSVRVVTRVEQFGAEAHEALLSELKARGVTAQTDGPGIQFELNGVDARILSRNSHLRPFFAATIQSFDPDIILTSTDDPAQLLLEVALRAPRARVVYLIRATIAAPFGPDSSMLSSEKTETLRYVDGMVGVSEYVAEYARRWAGLDAIHVPISLLEPGEPPVLGRFDNRFVSMVNPCGVKGISIFLALADRLPNFEFAAVPTWGTTAADLADMQRRANVVVLLPFDRFDDFLKQTKVMLVPSLWAEARSRVILEAMSRGIPVLASDVGGLREAMLGADYLLPVNPVTKYQAKVDELMVPMADIPPQNIEAWHEVLRQLLTDRIRYEAVAAESRQIALDYARNLTAQPFESYLEKVLGRPRRRKTAEKGGEADAKRKLIALRMKRKTSE